ncbi:MAG: ABC transporter ATP-binding protein [Truepera sp.]|nr:ABC transporter ATP-binding protein [Truepera sp.]
MIEVRRVFAGYGSESILRNLDLSIRRGEITVLVGPNGAGKSTVIRLLTRLLEPSSGKVLLDGRPLAGLRRKELARSMAVVPQAETLPDGFSAFEVVLMGRTPHLGFLEPEREVDLRMVEEAMRRTDIWRFRDRPVETLSGGERQRVVLARAIVQQPRFLLLDEPTNHLDLRHQVELLWYVRQEVEGGIGALVILHDLVLAARIAGRLLLMDRGRIVAEGSPVEVLRQDLIREVYQVEVDLMPDPSEGVPLVLPRLAWKGR